MNVIKTQIKKLLVAKQEKKYNIELKSKKVDYNSWALKQKQFIEDEKSMKELEARSQKIDWIQIADECEFNEKDRELAKTLNLCYLISIFSSLEPKNCKAQYIVCEPEALNMAIKVIKNGNNTIDGVILRIFDGNFENCAFKKIHTVFSENENKIVIYSDEDVYIEGEGYSKPWFKPDWAPDDFLSFFYFGSFVALRATAVTEYELSSEDIYDYLYKLLLFNRAFDKHCFCDAVGHIPSVLYHTHEISSYEQSKNMSLRYPIRQRVEDSLLSVIIPSKDHPDILFRCIDSFLDRTDIPSYLKVEFILVDNGSNELNKATIENLLENYRKHEKVEDFRYIYEKMPFNFANMCNRGASDAGGEYLLFLNDDIEIAENDWLTKLFAKVILPYAGAVGAKLLYPKAADGEEGIIQHAGITNLRIGPAHKLQRLSDSVDWYFGKNRYCVDMMGVTGACLMVRRAVFDEVGGFDENLAVAFNDVDLCYKIYEKGYYNIERNDTVLLHHESLSRGDDSESPEKMRRLAKEKDYLYEKHQALYGKDPFYNINLTTDMLESVYAPKYHYEVRLDREWADVSDVTHVVECAREDKCVRVGMECAMDIFKWKYGVAKEKAEHEPTKEELGYYFQGYTFVIGSNNACFEKMLLLENTHSKQVWGVSLDIEYRPDIRDNLKDQLNVDLTGYTAKVSANSLPEGEYRFGMYMKDKTSSLRLYNWSNWTLTVSH